MMLLITALRAVYLGLCFQLGAHAHAIAHEPRDTRASIAKRSQEKVLDVLDPANVVVSPPIPDMGVICWPQEFTGGDEQATLYNILKLAHDPDDKAQLYSPARSCSIKTCRHRAALLVCNDNDYPILTNTQALGQLAWRIYHQNACTNQDSKTCGQQFSKGHWNVILREVTQEECNSGELAQPEVETHN